MFRVQLNHHQDKYKIQNWYSQRVHTLWNPILFTVVLTFKFMYININFDVNKICKRRPW